MPRWLWTRRLVHSALYPMLLGVAYALGFFVALPGSDSASDGAGMGSLAGISAAFANPRTLLVGWVHYLVFDLFVGAWQARDAFVYPNRSFLYDNALWIMAGLVSGDAAAARIACDLGNALLATATNGSFFNVRQCATAWSHIAPVGASGRPFT